jgi:Peptidase family M28/Fibronectin type III domain
MQKLRYLVVAVVCVGLVSVVWILTTAPAKRGEGGERSASALLREIRTENVERSIRTLAGFGTRHTLSAQDDPVRGIGAARDWIYDEFTRHAQASGGRMTVELQSFIQEAGPRIPQPTRITNVVATLRGTDPASADRMYVVSGHYDSRCSDVLDAECDAPGANDDASGVAAVLELARVMAKRKFEATIVFMAVAGEEQGLFGSTYYAEQAKQQGLNVAGMFTNDIIGSSVGQNGLRDPRTVRLFAEGPPSNETPEEAAIRRTMGGENDSPARQLARFAKRAAERSAAHMRVSIIYRRDRFLRGGDHIPFLERRYPAVRFTEPNEDYRHQHQDVRVEDGVQFGDLLEFVDFAYTTRVARVNAAALAALANGPAAPQEVKVLTAELSNDTELEWEANPEPDLAGYEIVYRETTEPRWTHTIDVGNVTSFKVEGVTKDNFHFGVRAVDRDGNRSVVSFPTPKQ